MGYIRIESNGSGEVERTLERVADMPGLARKALQAGADVLLPKLKDAAPIGPEGGAHIRNRLEVRIRGGAKPTASLGVWDEPVAYYVEYGHGGPHPAPPHPYMQPAADEAEADVLDAIMTTIMDGLD